MSNWKDGNFLYEIAKHVQNFIEEDSGIEVGVHLRFRNFMEKHGYNAAMKTRDLINRKIEIDVIKPSTLEEITITDFNYE